MREVFIRFAVCIVFVSFSLLLLYYYIVIYTYFALFLVAIGSMAIINEITNFLTIKL